MISHGRTALIAGGSGGIGAAVARELAQRGARVFLVARDRQRLEQRARELEGSAIAVAVADVSDADAMQRAVDACVQEFGAPDILVNAAAVHGPIGPFRTAPSADWWQAVEINLRGTINACRAVLDGMLEAGWGRIINFSGGGATSPRVGFSAYGTAKAAVVRFTETLAQELDGTGVTVNAVAPGMVDTGLHDSVMQAGETAGADYAMIREIRAGRATGIAPEEAAQLVAWLASPAADGVSGKLVSAIHDPWRSWSEADVAELAARPWLTLRRIDAHTLADVAPVDEPA